MNTVDLGGVLHNKKMLMHNLKQNHHKLYISGKVMNFHSSKIWSLLNLIENLLRHDNLKWTIKQIMQVSNQTTQK